MKWLDRVKEEKRELDNKIRKLELFYYKAAENPRISPYSFHLLTKQLVIMKNYSDVLRERIRYEENKK